MVQAAFEFEERTATAVSMFLLHILGVTEWHGP